MRRCASGLGLSIVPVSYAGPSGLDDAFASMAKAACDAMIALADPINPTTARIPGLAAKARLPTIYQVSSLAKVGGLLSYGPDIADLYRRAAMYVDKIIKGANPAELPVEQPTKFDLLINLKAARALGLDVPDTLLAVADEVIE
jgi:putative ABC transport system substrate-binding protein